MNMPIEIVNPLSFRRWDDLVLETPGHSFFHLSGWARVLHESYGYRPAYFSIVDGGRLSALVPLMDVRSFLTGHRGVSLPFTDYCDPVFADDGCRRAVLESMSEYGRKCGWKFIEFRGGDYFTGDVTCYRYYHGHVLRLSGGAEQLLAGMRDSTRRNVLKAQRLGVRSEISTSLESVGEFYRLNCLTRKRHGLPPQPFRFFEKLHEHILSRDMGMIVLASHGGRYVAGAVFFHSGDGAIYKFGASDLDYQELRANNLVMWEAIRFYAGKSFKTLCMGRTEHDATGLRQFKTGWGAEEGIIRYFRYDPVRGSFRGDCSPVRERYYGVFHGLPVPLLKLAGNLLYRHMG